VGRKRCIVGIVRCFEEGYFFWLIVGLAERENRGMMLARVKSFDSF